MTLQRDLRRAALSLLLVAGALSALTRVFSDTSWVPVTLGAAVLALGLAAGSRALGFGVFGSLVASLVGLMAFTYTQHLEAGPLVPGAAQLAEARDLFILGMQQFRDEPAPTVPLDGLLLITSTSAWMVAMLTHELLVRWRSVGLAMLPAGVLWAVPLAVPLPPGRTWPQALPFAAAAAVTLLFESDADTTGAGVAVRATTTHPASRRGALMVGSILGASALLAAGFAPALLPGYESGAWIDLASGPDPRGYQPIVDIGDRLKLPAPADIMTVRSDRKVYLRLAALDSFDGTTWKVGPADSATFQPSPDALFPADGQLPREVAMTETTPLRVEVEVLDLENIYVPVPYQPVRLSGDGIEDMVYSTEGGFVAAGRLEDNEIGGREATGIRRGTTYTVESALPAADYATLSALDYSAASVARWTQLPRDYSRLAATAQDVFAAAGATTAIDRAFALQDWFTGPDSDFRYSLDVDVLRGDAALEDFVYLTQTGYCEYYATAMAVMLRASGIPARVSVGFLAGRLSLPADPGVGRDLNTYQVSSTDAHAWVEVLFPGHGWYRFEPTPRSDGAVQPPTPEDLDPLMTTFEQRLAAEANQAAPEEANPTASPSASESDRALQQLDDQDVGTNGSGTNPRKVPVGLLSLLALVGVASIPAWRFQGRVHRPDVAADERIRLAQRRVHRHADAYGVGRRDHETAREIAERWIDEGRVSSDAAHRFTQVVEATVFAPIDQATRQAAQAEDAESLGQLLVQGLRDSVEPRDRLLAPWRTHLRVSSRAARWAQARWRTLR